MENAKGKNFLKVTGILMIIFGAIATIIGIFTLISVISLISMPEYGLLVAAAILSFVGAVVELVTGIVGVKNCNDVSKSRICIIWGATIILISVISLVLNIIFYSSLTILSIVGFLIGLIIPVLFIIGAVLNRKQEQVQ